MSDHEIIENHYRIVDYFSLDMIIKISRDMFLHETILNYMEWKKSLDISVKSFPKSLRSWKAISLHIQSNKSNEYMKEIIFSLLPEEWAQDFWDFLQNNN